MTTLAPPLVSRRERRTEIAAAIEAVTASPVALARVIKITRPDGAIPLELWPHQVAMLRAARTYRWLVIVKARQLGATEALMELALWEALAYPVGHDLVVSLNLPEAQAAMNKATGMYDSAPEWLHDAFPVAVRNATEFSIKHGKTTSGIIVLPSSDNAGRGRTFRRVIADEKARWEHKEERMASLRFTVADTGSMVESSTAQGFDEHRDTFLGAVDPPADATRGNGYARMFIGALSRPGRTVEWVMAERQKAGHLGAQEMPLTATEAFLASGRCVFDQRALQNLLDEYTAPPMGRYDLRHQDGVVVADPELEGRWMVWEWPRAGRSYVVAADVCGGGGGDDYAYATVHDAESWDQVACLHGRPDPGVLAAELAKAGWLYGSDGKPALLVPEANNHGQAVVALLSEWGYPRIYAREAFDRRGSAPVQSSLLGYLTTTKSREVAIAALQDAIRDGEAGIRDAAAIGECLAFVDKDGRVEAAEGSHDDRVLALAIAYAVLARSRAGRRVVQKPQAPYVPRVSTLTGYHPKFFRGWWI